MRSFALALALAVLMALGWVVLRGSRTAPVPGAVPPALAASGQGAPAAAVAVPAAAAQPAPAAGVPQQESRQWLLPDGTRVATLNGATDAPPLAGFWGTSVPWSPILGIERNDQGLDWYRHANGSYSTTQMVWRSDLGRNLAMTRVAHPAPVGAPPAAAPTNR